MLLRQKNKQAWSLFSALRMETGLSACKQMIRKPFCSISRSKQLIFCSSSTLLFQEPLLSTISSMFFSFLLAFCGRIVWRWLYIAQHHAHLYACLLCFLRALLSRFAVMHCGAPKTVLWGLCRNFRNWKKRRKVKKIPGGSMEPFFPSASSSRNNSMSDSSHFP